jgi:hypothetical protein
VDGIAFFATLLVISVRRCMCCCYKHKFGDALCIAIIFYDDNGGGSQKKKQQILIDKNHSIFFINVSLIF